LRYGIGEPTAIVPPDAVTLDDLVVVDALFDSLTAYDAGLYVQPAAAVAWQSDESQQVWTFRLREGARFHAPQDQPDEPGPPVRAADFKLAWEVAVARGAAGFHLELVEGYEEAATGVVPELSGVEAPDDLTLVVRLREPLSTFPALVAHPALGPLPEALWHADEAAFREQPVGNGPFRAAEDWVRGQFIRVQRFPEWRDEAHAPALDEVLFQIADPDSAYVAFQQGRLQVSPLPLGAVGQAIRQFGTSPDGYRGPGVLQGETPTLYLLGFNVTQPPFDDPEIRRAVSLAIDRDALVEEVDAHVSVAASITGSTLPHGRDDVCSACIHDPEAAEAIFDERDIERLRLWFNRDGGHEPVARRLRADLAEVGVVLELQASDFADYLGHLERGDAGLFRYGWSPEHATLDEMLYPLFHSREIGVRNYMRYSDQEVDELLDGARSAQGSLRQLFHLRRVEDIVLERDQVVVPLMRYHHAHVVSDRVEGFRMDPLGRVNLAEVTLSLE
jgi:ABC-type transport system substrate-binding protein